MSVKHKVEEIILDYVAREGAKDKAIILITEQNKGSVMNSGVIML